MPITTTEDYQRYSPYDAALLNKSEEDVVAFEKRFTSLPVQVRTFITSLATAERIQELVSTGVVPEEYAAAIAKLVCLVALQDVKPEQIPSLLEKIQFPVASRDIAVRALSSLLQDAVSARAAAETQPLKQLRPLVTHAPASADGASASPRGILDLKKPAP